MDIFLFLRLQIAFTFAVYPSLILAYMGQAAYLSKHHVLESDYRIGFYVSVPGKSTHHLVNRLKMQFFVWHHSFHLFVCCVQRKLDGLFWQLQFWQLLSEVRR